jgi:hypothetical protein
LITLPRDATRLLPIVCRPQGRAAQGYWRRCAVWQYTRYYPPDDALPETSFGTLKYNE